jgi:PBSX family phage terminase large subunit
MHKPFCTWYSSKSRLIYRGKEIQILGATNEGSIGTIQGTTFSVVYCDEMQLYPHSIIEMISTRLSNPHSIGFASMNPTFPSHPLKKWIDLAEAGDESFYSMHFTLDDNPFLTKGYKDDLKKTLSGVFYKRNYLGLWCQAEGAIYDFFDEDIHVWKKPERCAEYWIAGIDFGMSNPTACLLIGVSTGRNEHADPMMWVEKEYYWNNKKQRPKLVGEFADEIKEFLEPHAVRNIYIDPSAEVLQQELQRRRMHCVHATNKVDQGILSTTSKMQRGGLYIMKECKNTIREIQQYVWDPKAAKQGYDEPLKEEDHCFCAGTLISTDKGIIPIENIKEGIKALTRCGYKRVVATGNREAEVAEYDLYGTIFNCTPDHKFFTERGWIEIENLIQSDILYIRQLKWLQLEPTSNSSSSMAGDIDDINRLKNTMKEITSLPMGDIIIESCTSPTLEIFPKDLIFITQTGIHLTMIYPISNVSQESDTSSCILKIFTQIRSHYSVWKEQKNGTDQKKDESGTRLMLWKVDWENGGHRAFFANNADALMSLQKNQTTDFVRIIVSLNGEEPLELIMSKEYARFALQDFKSIDIRKPNAALAPALKDSQKKAIVYNMNVEFAREFFANGYLVHNCMDALRYAVASHKISTFDQDEYNRNIEKNWRQNNWPGGSRF